MSLLYAHTRLKFGIIEQYRATQHLSSTMQTQTTPPYHTNKLPRYTHTTGAAARAKEGAKGGREGRKESRRRRGGRHWGPSRRPCSTCLDGQWDVGDRSHGGSAATGRNGGDGCPVLCGDAPDRGVRGVFAHANQVGVFSRPGEFSLMKVALGNGVGGELLLMLLLLLPPEKVV